MKMTKVARKALLESIEVWKVKMTVDNPDDIHLGFASCPLCRIFYVQKNYSRCTGCPIAMSTGATCCDGSPHELAVGALDDWGYYHRGTKRQFRTAARKMIKFMEDLL